MSRLRLPKDEVHVWSMRLDLSEVERARLHASLTPEECAQAERLKSEDARRRFICAEAILRDVLSRYVGGEPGYLSFERNAHGKPHLPADRGLSFNLSHSHDNALIAVARDRELGIDIERINPERPLRRLIERFFSPMEAEELREVPEESLPDAFYTCWTRKEAYVKALGIGLSFGMRRFAVSTSADQPALLHVQGEPGEPGRWTLLNLPADEGFRATLVAEGRGFDVRYLQWSPNGLANGEAGLNRLR